MTNDTKGAAERLRCCGTCKWAESLDASGPLAPPWENSLDCNAPVPDAFNGRRRLMFPSLGTDCPCYGTKEAT